MKRLLVLLLIIPQISLGLTIKGQTGTWVEPLKIQFNQQKLTTIGPRNYLIETGNQNWLINPDFQDSTKAAGWTIGTPIASDGISTLVKYGNLAQAYSQTINDTTILPTKILGQAVTVQGIMTGKNIKGAMFIYGTVNNNSTVQVCISVDSVEKSCVTVPKGVNNRFDEYRVYTPGGTGNNTYEVYSKVTSTSAAGVSNVLTYGKSYLGPADDIGSGTPPNDFKATINGAGTILRSNIPNWLSCSTSGGSSGQYDCTFNSSVVQFGVIPICIAGNNSAENAANTSVRIPLTAQTLTGFTARTWYSNTTNSYSNTNYEWSVTCSKASPDSVQNTITANNLDYDWTNYTLTSLNTASGTLANYSITGAQHARRDGKLWLKGRLTFIGSPGTWGGPKIPIPLGLIALNPSFSVKGGVGLVDNGTNTYTGGWYLESSTSIQLTAPSVSTGLMAFNQGSPYPWASGDIMDWEIGPIDIVGWTPSQGAPQLVGSVTSNAPAAINVFSGRSFTSCVSSPCSMFTSLGITNVTRAGAGAYTINVPAGSCSSGLACSINSDGARTVLGATTATTQAFNVQDSAGAGGDGNFSFNCSCPR